MRYHPPIYYKVRTFVRFVFWMSVIWGTLWVTLAIGNALVKPTPDCERFVYPCDTDWDK